MKKSAKQGIDGANFELVLNGIGRDQYIKHQPLINQHGKEFGSVETKDGKALIQLNFPKFVRQNNVVNGKYFPAKNGNYFPAVSGK